MAKTKSIRALLKDLEPDELREIILELCKLSPKNQRFLELYLQGSDAVDPQPILEEAKKKIHACFYGRSLLPKLFAKRIRALQSVTSHMGWGYGDDIQDLVNKYVRVA